jgi:PilZ domain
MQEQRQLERSKTYLGAEISFSRQISPIECVVRNLSSRGAMLQLNHVSAIPRHFEIRIPTKSKSYRARIVWQQLGRAGLAFDNADAHKGPEYNRRAPSITDQEWLDQRIRVILNR